MVATGLTISDRKLFADDAGDLFFTQDWTSSSCRTDHGPRVVGAGAGAAVSPNGFVAAQTKGARRVLLYDPSGASRRIPGMPYNYLLARAWTAPANVVILNPTSGASGYYSIGVVPAGTTTYTSLLEPDAVVALDHEGVLSGCRPPRGATPRSRNTGSCVEDTRVTRSGTGPRRAR